MPASPSGPAPDAPPGARPGGAPEDLAAVWSAITGMYAAYTTGDRARIDSFLDPEATIWDSATPALVRGNAELQRVRDTRPASPGAPTETLLTAYDEVIDVFADLALVRYWLRVDFTSGPPETVRNTALLRRGWGRVPGSAPGGGWVVVHLHEDVQGGG